LVIVSISNTQISNILVDLGAAINVMIFETLKGIGCTSIRPTSTILQLTDRSTIKPYGLVEDILVIFNQWKYPVDFMVVKVKTNMPRYPIILGHPWLATTNAYIECRIGNMIISNG